MNKDEIAAVKTRLMALEKRTKKLAQMAQQVAQEVNGLWFALLVATEETTQDRDRGNIGTLKRGKRLNDAGIWAVNAAFASGATVTEVAREFELSPSAAHNRRTLWLAEKGVKEGNQ